MTASNGIQSNNGYLMEVLDGHKSSLLHCPAGGGLTLVPRARRDHAAHHLGQRGLALRHDVAIGSHPSLPDLIGFWRRTMDVSPTELKDLSLLPDGRAAGMLLGGLRAALEKAGCQVRPLRDWLPKA
jgi:hypothetical protein